MTNRPTMKCAPCSGLSPPPPRPVHRHRPGRRHRGGPRSRAGRPGGDGDPVDADLHRRARLLRGQRGDHRGRRRWGRRPLPLHHRGRRALRHRARRQRVPRWRRDHEPREPPRPARGPRRAASAVARSRGWCQRLRRRPVARRRERRRDPRRRRAGEQRRTSLRLRLPRVPTRPGRGTQRRHRPVDVRRCARGGRLGALRVRRRRQRRHRQRLDPRPLARRHPLPVPAGGPGRGACGLRRRRQPAPDDHLVRRRRPPAGGSPGAAHGADVRRGR